MTRVSNYDETSIMISENIANTKYVQQLSLNFMVKKLAVEMMIRWRKVDD